MLCKAAIMASWEPWQNIENKWIGIATARRVNLSGEGDLKADARELSRNKFVSVHNSYDLLLTFVCSTRILSLALKFSAFDANLACTRRGGSLP